MGGTIVRKQHGATTSSRALPPPIPNESSAVKKARAHLDEVKKNAAPLQDQAQQLRMQIQSQQAKLGPVLDRADSASDGARPGQLQGTAQDQQKIQAELDRLNAQLRSINDILAPLDVSSANHQLWVAQNTENQKATAASKDQPYPELGPDPAAGDPAASMAPLSEADRQRMLGEVQGSLDTLPVASKLKADVQEAIATDPNLAASYDTILKGLNGLPGDVQAAVLRQSSIALGKDAHAIAGIVGSSSWQLADATQKSDLTTFIGNATATCQLQDLAKISQDPNRLLNPDKDGKTLLSNLTALSGAQMDGRITAAGQPPSELLSSAIRDVANPSAITQGPDTCTAAGMQYYLAQNNPSEYVRLMTGLGTKGEVDMRGGERLSLQTEYLKQKPDDRRSLSQVLFQSSMMEFANGNDTYDAAQDKSFKAENGQAYDGLSPTEIRDGLTSLFGRDFHYVPDKSSVLPYLEAYKTGANTPPLMLNITSPGISGHDVTFLKSENGRVYFRDPSGPTNLNNGSALYGDFRVEDNASGVYSIQADALMSHLKDIVTDREAYEQFRAGRDPTLPGPGDGAAAPQKASDMDQYRQAQRGMPN